MPPYTPRLIIRWIIALSFMAQLATFSPLVTGPAWAGDNCNRGIYNRTDQNIHIEVKKHGGGTYKAVIPPYANKRIVYHNDVHRILITRLSGYTGARQLMPNMGMRNLKKYSLNGEVESIRFSGWGKYRITRDNPVFLSNFIDQHKHASCYWAHRGKTRGFVLNEPANGDIRIIPDPSSLLTDCVALHSGANGTGPALHLCGYTRGWNHNINLGLPENRTVLHNRVRSITCGENVRAVTFVGPNGARSAVVNCTPGKAVNVLGGRAVQATHVMLSPDGEIEAAKFANSLAGSYWQYKHGGQSYIFRLGLSQTGWRSAMRHDGTTGPAPAAGPHDRGFLQNHTKASQYWPGIDMNVMTLKLPFFGAQKVRWYGESKYSITLTDGRCRMEVRISDFSGNEMKSDKGWCGQSGPLLFKRFLERVSGPKAKSKLFRSLSGSSWAYINPAGGTMKFRFGAPKRLGMGQFASFDASGKPIINGGLLEGVPGWEKVAWRVTSSDGVTLTYPNSYKRYLIFTDYNNYREVTEQRKTLYHGKRIRWLTPPPDVALREALAERVGTIQGTRFKFGQDGKIQSRVLSKGISWRVTGGNTVEFLKPGRSGPERMTLRFTNHINFTTMGWNGRGWVFARRTGKGRILPKGTPLLTRQDKIDPAKSRQFRQSLALTVWSITAGRYGDSLRFGINGFTEGGKWHNQVQWVAHSGPSNWITLIHTKTGARMTLEFNGQKTFTSRGWNGRGWPGGTPIATGRLTGKGPAPQTPREIAACQRLSDTYAIFHQKGWGLAPTPVRHQWVAKKCKTIPNTAYWPALCQKLSTTYGISYQRSWGKADYSAKSTYHNMKCTTRPLTVTAWRPRPAPRPVTAPQRPNPPPQGGSGSVRPPVRPAGGQKPVDGGCAMLAQTRSTGGGESVLMTFVNKSGKRLNIQWITTSGGRKFYKTIAPEERYAIKTSSHHPWLVSDMEGQCVSVVVPKRHMPQVVIH